MSENTTTFHNKAKDAGNRLSAYIMNYASAASGVFFWALVQDSAQQFSSPEKQAVIAALCCYVLTVVLRLFELHIDAKRFYEVARQLDLPEDGRHWHLNEQYKSMRLKLIYTSYWTITAATVAALAFALMRVW